MSCQHQINISMCRIHNCANCEYKGGEEKCPFHLSMSVEDRTPTFAQMLEIYDKSPYAEFLRKASVRSTITCDLEVVGLTLESKASEMTRTKFKELMRSFKDPHRKNGVLADTSIDFHLGAFKAISSPLLEDLYEDSPLGLDRPAFSIPIFRYAKPPVQEVSDEQIRLVEIQMEKWLASGDRSDLSCYIYCFFGLYCGFRSGDVCWAKWNVITMTSVGAMVQLVPRKTRRKGTKVAFVLPHKVYCKIKPVMGAPEDWVIPRFENRIGKNAKRHGHYSGLHRYMTHKVNVALRACGLGGKDFKKKAFHALRKYFETDLALKTDKVTAAQAVGHSLDVQRDSYLGTIAGKVAA